jgi:hypothetical protein
LARHARIGIKHEREALSHGYIESPAISSR